MWTTTGDMPATPLACGHSQFRILQSILTTELTPCVSAKHMHSHTHGERPPTDTAHMGAAAQVVRVAEHAATHTDLQHMGVMAQVVHMSATACRGPTDCDFIDLKEHRTEQCTSQA